MKLYKKEQLVFETYQMLTSMIELSKARKESPGTFGLNMVGFTLGRQSGQTTAIKKYMSDSISNVAVVVSDRNRKQMYEKDLNEAKSKVLALTESLVMIDEYRGLKREEITPEVVIFDECSYGDARYWLDCNEVWDQSKIKAVVVVGSAKDRVDKKEIPNEPRYFWYNRLL